MARKMTFPSGRGPGDIEPHSPAPRRIARPACAAVFVLVMFGVIHGMLGRSALVAAAAAVVLAVTAGETGLRDRAQLVGYAFRAGRAGPG
jgi:hypothetical protein